MHPTLGRWRVTALRIASLGFALWFLVVAYGEDWTRPGIAALSSALHFVFYGAVAIFSALAAQHPSQPPAGRGRAGPLLLTLSLTAIQCIGSVVMFVVIAIRFGPQFWPLLQALAFAVPLWLTWPMLRSVKLETRPIDGPGGPGPLAPA